MTDDPLARYLKTRRPGDFGRLLEDTREPLYDIAYRRLRDEGLAEDVVQEVYEKVVSGAIRNAHSVRYLYTVAWDLARRKLRSQARRPEKLGLTRDVLEAHVECCSGSNHHLLDIEEAVGGLPERLKECVELRYFKGLTVTEVAETLGESERNIYRKLRDVRESLRGRLARAVGELRPAGS